MNTNKTTTTTPQPAKGAPIYANRVTLVGYLGKVLDTRDDHHDWGTWGKTVHARIELDIMAAL